MSTYEDEKHDLSRDSQRGRPERQSYMWLTFLTRQILFPVAFFSFAIACSREIGVVHLAKARAGKSSGGKAPVTSTAT